MSQIRYFKHIGTGEVIAAGELIGNIALGINVPDEAYAKYGFYPVSVIKSQLSRAEVKLKLAEIGILAAVENAISQLPIDNRLRIRYENALYFERTDLDLVTFCHDSLGWNDENIDDFFAAEVTLNAA